MDIRKIKLNSGGNKGAEITVVKPDQMNPKFTKEVIEKRKYPIHNDLDQLFKQLRYHALNIADMIHSDMDKLEVDYAVSDCEIDGIKTEGSEFLIIGKKRCRMGKYMKIETPKIDSGDEQEGYGEILDIIGKIKDEATQYMNGTKMISPEEAVIRMIESGKCEVKGIDNYSTMTDDEKKEFHTKALQTMFGSLVTHIEDVEDVDDEGVEHEVQVIDMSKAG